MDFIIVIVRKAVVLMDVKVKLEHFEGPLDLLLHLVEKAEMDIYEVSISAITDQYMNILAQAKENRLDIASEFLVMAATLLAIKSRMLLPRQSKILDEDTRYSDEGLDPREQLIEKLLEYKRFKRLGQVLAEKEEERSKVFSRPAMDFTGYSPESRHPLEGISFDQLMQAFVEVLKQQKKPESIATVVREEISVSARILELVDLLEQHKQLVFWQLFSGQHISRELLITTFLALLEMMRGKQIRCEQERPFAEMSVFWIGTTKEQEMSIANG